MVIIFLDIDGVMISLKKSSSVQEPGYLVKRDAERKIVRNRELWWGYTSQDFDEARVDLFDELALSKLNELISHIEARGEIAGIVISSTWRYSVAVEQLKKLLQKHDFSRKIIDKTADDIYLNDSTIEFSEHLSRAEEIEVWLQQNRVRFNISNFLILDDCDDKLSELFPHNFVQCKDGTFNQRNLNEAYLKLNQQQLIPCPDRHPVNKLQLSIATSDEKNPWVPTEVSLRVALDTRKYFLSGFFKHETNLFETITNEQGKSCFDLIEEYDMGERKIARGG